MYRPLLWFLGVGYLWSHFPFEVGVGIPYSPDTLPLDTIPPWIPYSWIPYLSWITTSPSRLIFYLLWILYLLWIPNPWKRQEIPYHPCPQKGHGTRDQDGTWHQKYSNLPPPPGKTNTCENITFPQLCWRAEIKGQPDCGANFRLSEPFHFQSLSWISPSSLQHFACVLCLSL